MMKSLFLILIMLFAQSVSSQVVDSTRINTDIYYVSGHHNLVNLGEDGFVIYGTKANLHKGLSCYSKTFAIQYYDVSFHATEEKDIVLSANGLQASVAVYLDLIYFLVPCEMSKTVYLIKYNFITKAIEAKSFQSDWKHPQEFAIRGTDDVVYISYTSVTGSSKNGEEYIAHLEMIDLSKPEWVPQDILPDEISSGKPSHIWLLDSKNATDSLFCKVDLTVSNETSKSKFLGFYHSTVVANAKIECNIRGIENSYRVSCDKNIYFTFPEAEKNKLVYSWLRFNENHLFKEYAEKSVCGIPVSGIKFSGSSSCITLSSFNSENRMLKVQRWDKSGNLIANDSVEIYNEKEPLTPWAPYNVVSHEAENTNYYLCTYNEKLTEFVLDNQNRLILKKTFHFPVTDNAPGRPVKNIFTEEYYADYYLAYFFTVKSDQKGMTGTVYKCKY